MKIVMLMSRSIVPASKKKTGTKLLFRFSLFFLLGQSVLFTWPVCFYGTLLLLLVLLTTTTEKKTPFKIYSTEFFMIFPVSSSVASKRIFRKKNMGDAIDGKKWVKFVAMQQDSATLIYDFNTMKGTMESYLKRIAQPFKTVQF